MITVAANFARPLRASSFQKSIGFARFFRFVSLIVIAAVTASSTILESIAQVVPVEKRSQAGSIVATVDGQAIKLDELFNQDGVALLQAEQDAYERKRGPSERGMAT